MKYYVLSFFHTFNFLNDPMKYPLTFFFGGVENRLREDRNPAKILAAGLMGVRFRLIT